MSLLGASPPRKDDRRLLTGAGRFLDDIVRQGVLHLGVVRSLHAHARIAKIRAAGALTQPGIVAAWAADDLPEVRRPIPGAYGAGPKGRPWAQPVLARDVVRYVGEPVAIVVAEDP